MDERKQTNDHISSNACRLSNNFFIIRPTCFGSWPSSGSVRTVSPQTMFYTSVLHVFMFSVCPFESQPSCLFLFLSLLSPPVSLHPALFGLVPVIFQSCHLLTKWLCWERLTPLIFSRSFFCVEPYSKTWVIGLHNVLIKSLSDWLKTAETRVLHHGEAALSHCCVRWQEATSNPQLDRVNLSTCIFVLFAVSTQRTTYWSIKALCITRCS